MLLKWQKYWQKLKVFCYLVERMHKILKVNLICSERKGREIQGLQMAENMAQLHAHYFKNSSLSSTLSADSGRQRVIWLKDKQRLKNCDELSGADESKSNGVKTNHPQCSDDFITEDPDKNTLKDKQDKTLREGKRQRHMRRWNPCTGEREDEEQGSSSRTGDGQRLMCNGYSEVWNGSIMSDSSRRIFGMHTKKSFNRLSRNNHVHLTQAEGVQGCIWDRTSES